MPAVPPVPSAGLSPSRPDSRIVRSRWLSSKSFSSKARVVHCPARLRNRQVIASTSAALGAVCATPLLGLALNSAALRSDGAASSWPSASRTNRLRSATTSGCPGSCSRCIAARARPSWSTAATNWVRAVNSGRLSMLSVVSVATELAAAEVQGAPAINSPVAGSCATPVSVLARLASPRRKVVTAMSPKACSSLTRSRSGSASAAGHEPGMNTDHSRSPSS